VRIHCDYCGAEIAKEGAIVRETEDGEVLYFCSDECLESSDYHETLRDPDRGEEGAGTDVR
jgi:ribosomal protein L24E